MSMNRHEPFEELLSSALTDDLTADERSRLDAHLDTCDGCRATMASFADGRRIVAGLRHVAPPRDLGARVRSGIESGSTVGLPWWRRPAVLFVGVGGGLAAVAGALLALVLLNGSPEQRPVGDASPSATASTAASTAATAAPTAAPTPTAVPTLPPIGGGPAPSATPAESAAPLPSDASPAPTPIPASPEPDLFLAMTGPFDNLGLTLRDGRTGDTMRELGTPSGPPVAAEMSPDGQWVAYITQKGQSGLNEVRVARVADATEGSGDDAPIGVGEDVVLAEGAAGSPFLERLSWSPDGRRLAFTIADPEDATTDAWVFLTSGEEARPVTDEGNAYAGSWAAGPDGMSLLWVSVAGPEPRSYLVPFRDDASEVAVFDPSESPFPSTNVFQPLVSPNGALVIYWDGRMEQSGAEWLFSEGGAPWLAENRRDGEAGYRFESSRLLFSDVMIEQDAFRSAAIAWGPDSNAYAAWRTDWTGVSQEADREYPDPSSVYLGRATDPGGLDRTHDLDAGDVPEGEVPLHVAVAPTGRHLAITSLRPVGGIGDAPRATLTLVTRNTGDVADETRRLGEAADGWFGPAVYDAVNESEAP